MRREAVDLLRDRSTTYLVDSFHFAEYPLGEATTSPQERKRAAEFGVVVFAQVNSMLKVAIDSSDVETFRKLERKWAGMLEYEIAHGIGQGTVNGDALARLSDYRNVLRLGLAMWAAHRLSQEPSIEAGVDSQVEALRILAGRFPSAEGLLDTYEKASEREEREGAVPWTEWFLWERGNDDDEFSAIPTSQELTLATMLFMVGRVAVDGLEELRPRPWFEFRKSEMEGALERLRGDGERWAYVLGLSDASASIAEDAGYDQWANALERFEGLLEQGREVADAHRRALLRETPLDPELVAEFRGTLLKAASERRVLRDLFEAQGALRRLGSADARERVGRYAWLSKRLLVADSRMVGISTTARSLSRVAPNAEMRQLITALEAVETQEAGEGLADRLREEVCRMEEDGHPATLLLLPISWRLRQALDLPMWGTRGAEGNPLVPSARAGEFELFEQVPTLDLPHVPKDRLWLLNLPSLATFVEWPSDEDSGIRLGLKTFDAEEASAFLRENPAVREKAQTHEEAVQTLQERVLCSQFLTWRLEAGENPAATCFFVPLELQR